MKQTHSRRSGNGGLQKLELGIEDRKAVARVLERVLADENVLYMKTKHCHWNVEGPQFVALHKLFEDQYEMLDVVIDEVAERIRSIGDHPMGTFASYLENARHAEADDRRMDSDVMVTTLLADHEAMARHLHEDIKACEAEDDVGTVDLLTAVLRKHEKQAWILRSLRG